MTGMILTKCGKVPIKCHPVTIPGFEEYRFIAHHPYNPHYESKEWVISEASTGCCVFPSPYPNSMSNKTRAGAIEIVREYLERNRDRFIATMERESQKVKP